MTNDEPLVTAVQRPHPARSDLQTYPVTGAGLARFGDVDANGHLNNLALASLHENARAEFNTAVFPGVYEQATRAVRVVVASSVLHYLAEAHWPAAVTTGLGVGRIGRTSYVLSTALFVDQRCVSLCDTVLVTLVDDAPAPIPDAARVHLAAHRLR
ncbi:acyl-CoA thioesterase [Mycobacterium hackensackense]|jgi:acyl-CoA thioester hydrolase|uniref:acyl-CoA thioesterase n=1 Tax=Mycobacterium hackensackense TaxID=228909 RepID=UPI002265868A|nr:acyl-CoA thioesterase [Mycobacterium hackensackense]MCV7253230.1 acyl-CoA thioesterase [Mycobacterium hackensackense]